MRVERLIHGNPGSHRDLRHGVSELKVDVGPGYRVYCTKRGDHFLLLLIGGDKSTQAEDIVRAIRLAQTYGEQLYGNHFPQEGPEAEDISL